MGLASRIATQKVGLQKPELEVWTGRTQQEQWVVENLSRRGPVDISTPVALVNEMLDQLWKHVKITPEMKFLDPACGRGTFLRQLLIRLIQEPCLVTKFPSLSDREAYIRQSMLYGFEIDAAFVHVLQRQGYVNVTLQNALEYKVGMKFDVVIGNPPYQDPNDNVRSNPLWSRITLLAFSLLKKGGALAFITPPMWMSGADEQSPTKKREIVDIFFKNKLVYLRPDASAKYFPRVGTKAASYVVIKGEAPTDKTLLLRGEDHSSIDTSKVEMLPLGDFSPEVISVFYKVFYSKPERGFSSQGCVGTNKLNYESKTGTYQVYNSRQTLVATDVASGNASNRKLVVSLPGHLAPFYEPGVYGLSVNCRWFAVANQAEADVYIEALASPLFELLFAAYRYNGFNSTWMVKHFPTIDPFTSLAELYEQFNLTPQEVAYIESTVK
jgi:hypothetical protein